jgi:hypothetical protein
MDPLGFALEHFDAIGQWRDNDGKFPIDSSGTLPDGRSFKDYKDFLSILSADPQAFTECFNEKLLTDALGRGLEPYDRTAIRAIAASTAKNEHRLSSVVLAIVQSVPFQMQKTGQVPPVPSPAESERLEVPDSGTKETRSTRSGKTSGNHP